MPVGRLGSDRTGVATRRAISGRAGVPIGVAGSARTRATGRLCGFGVRAMMPGRETAGSGRTGRAVIGAGRAG